LFYNRFREEVRRGMNLRHGDGISVISALKGAGQRHGTWTITAGAKNNEMQARSATVAELSLGPWDGSEAVATPCELFPSALSPSSLPFMSHAQPGSSSSNFQLVINNALDKYKKRTKNDLIIHPLAAQLQSCNSPTAILAVLQQQVQGLDQSRSTDERWSRWLDPTVSVIYALSSTLAAGVGLVCLST
jgi:hypothetical protein